MSYTLLKNCNVFDGQNEGLAENVTITVENGCIREIGSFNPGIGEHHVVDVKGRFVMPGLIDAHFHAFTPLFDFLTADAMPMSLMAQHARRLLEGALRRGFTTIRDAGGADFGLAAAIKANLIDGPRLLFSGKALSQTGGHGDLRRPDLVDMCACNYAGLITKVVDGADEVRLAVREELRRGANQIKLMLSGGVFSPTDPIWMPQFTDDEITAAVEEARTRRTYVMAHAHTADAALRCVKLGIRSIEHGTLIDAKTAKEIARHDTYVVPTLVISSLIKKSKMLSNLPSSTLDKAEIVRGKALEALENCYRAGVKIGFGTDLLGDLHPFQGTEFVLRQEVMPAVDILRSATIINAALIGETGKLGVIAEGAAADLIALDGNPLSDISVLAHTEKTLALVMKAGRIYENKLS